MSDIERHSNPNELLTYEIVYNSPSHSGVRFGIDCGQFIIRMPLRPIEESDENLIVWYEQKLDRSYTKLKSFYIDFEDYRIATIREARIAKSMEHTGGYAVTMRNKKVLEETIPGVSDLIAIESGKIIFIGNGLSLVPLSIGRQTILVDMYDYHLLFEDLSRLSNTFEKYNLKPPHFFTEYFESAKLIDAAIQDNSVRAINYYFGSENPPKILSEAQLLINSHGPPYSTINEQLGLLSVGGILATSHGKFYDPDYHFMKIPLESEYKAEYAAAFLRVQ